MLHYSEMPSSFTSQSLLWLQAHPFEDKSGLWNAIYMIGTAILLSTSGSIYHGFQAIKNKVYAIYLPKGSVKNHHSILAWEHTKACVLDLYGVGNVFYSAVSRQNKPDVVDELAIHYLNNSAVKVDVMEDKASDKIKNKLKLQLLSLGKLPESWGVCAYHFRVCQAYSYSKLMKHVLQLKKEFNEELSINDKSVLKSFQLDSKGIDHDVIRYPNLIQQKSVTYIDPKDDLPDYKIPWKSVTMVICSIASFALAKSGLSWVLTSSIQTPHQYMLLSFPLVLGGIFLLAAKAHYIVNRGNTEFELAIKMSKLSNYRQMFHWLQKAADRGYIPAQRVLGLSYIVHSSGSHDPFFQDGFQRILKGISGGFFNSDGLAIDDIFELIKDNPHNHPNDPEFFNLASKPEQRFIDLFKDVDVQKIGKDRYSKYFQESGIENVLINQERLDAAKVLMEQNTFIPDVAYRITEFI